MQEREHQTRGTGSAIGCVAMVVLLPVLYVLALGPVAWAVKGNPAAENFANFIYYPVGVAGEYFWPIRAPLRWYIDLWGG